MRPLERLRDPVVAAGAGAAERGHVDRRRVGRRLVDDVDEPRVGIALAEEADPLLHLGLLVGLRQATDPARLLAAPDEGVLLEGDVVLHGVGVHGVEGGPVHLITRPLDRAPLPRVLRRELVPEHAEVRPDLAARVDVADEFLEGGRRAAAAGGSGCTRSACSTPARCSARAAPARRTARAAPAGRACRAAQAGAGAPAPVVPPRPAAPPCPATPIVPAAPDAPAAPASPPSPAEPMGTPPPPPVPAAPLAPASPGSCRAARGPPDPDDPPAVPPLPPVPPVVNVSFGHAGNEKHRRQHEGGGMTRSCHARLKHRPLLSLRSLIPPVPVDVE